MTTSYPLFIVMSLEKPLWMRSVPFALVIQALKITDERFAICFQQTEVPVTAQWERFHIQMNSVTESLLFFVVLVPDEP